MNSNKNYVLSIYPLSTSFQEKLEKSLDAPPVYILLSELHQKSLWQLWRSLRNLRAEQLFLPIEYTNIQLFLPLLRVLSLPMRVKKILVVHPDGSLTPAPKFKALLAVGRLFIQTALFSCSYLRCRDEIPKLLNKPNEQYSLNTGKSVLYVDATIRMGPKAGGSIGHIGGVANALANLGYTVDYAAEARIPSLIPKIDFIKIRLPQLFTFPVEFNRFRLNNQMIAQLSKIDSSHYQFIYQRMSMKNYAGAKLSRLLKIPLVMEYNGPLVWITEHWEGKLNKLKFKKLALQCEEVCIKHAHLIVTISEASKDALIQSGVSPKKIVCYPNCIDPTIFDPQRFSSMHNAALRNQLNIPAKSIVITFIGTFGEWHGVDILALAIRNLLDNHAAFLQPHSVRFLLIGNGAKMPLVKGILEQAPYKDHVIFTGLVSQEQAPAYLAISDIFLSPHIPNRDGSRFFGSPTKLFEYMAMEKPIIASDLEQLGQVLQPSLRAAALPQLAPEVLASELAILAQPGHVEHIVNAILFLIQFPQWRTLLGKNARQEVLAKYTWRQHVELILEKVNSLS